MTLKIKLTDDEPMKAFMTLTPRRIEVFYKDLLESIYLDDNGYFFAYLTKSNNPEIRIEKIK